MDQRLAKQIVESLRKGVPPQRGVSFYSVGNERLIQGVSKHHLGGIDNQGIIRFVSGSWGAGKTHFFRQLREAAFESNCVVSNVELNANSAALNKFHTIISAIVRQIQTPANYVGQERNEIAPFGSVVRASLAWLSAGERSLESQITYEQVDKARSALMRESSIDIDFKKMVTRYWETYLADSPDQSIVEQSREEILQWFTGEMSQAEAKKKYAVNKVLTKDTSKILLESLAGFIRLSGYKGLVILFDEAEQSYSVMRKADLKQAHNNLLSLINNIEDLPGLLLIYATTPDFFTDPKHGINTYGALSGRIGRPQDHKPRALDLVWNLDAIEPELNDYEGAALKVREIYASAYPDAISETPSEVEVVKRVRSLHGLHPSLAEVRFWRLLVTALVTDFDDFQEGETREPEKLYEDVMDRLREE